MLLQVRNMRELSTQGCSAEEKSPNKQHKFKTDMLNHINYFHIKTYPSISAIILIKLRPFKFAVDIPTKDLVGLTTLLEKINLALLSQEDKSLGSILGV